jgi:hypothetical protein
VSVFIVNGHWELPHSLQIHYPQLQQITNQVTIPIEAKDNELNLNHSSLGSLSLKEAYLYMSPQGQHLFWSKLVWQPTIPPTRSLLVGV